jgi:hypothetical protein
LDEPGRLAVLPVGSLTLRPPEPSLLQRLGFASHTAWLRILGASFILAGIVLPAVPGYHGLFACPLLTLTGVPCPLCGMSTSVHATVRGDLDGAFAANPAGVGAVLVAAALMVRPPTRMRLRAPVVVAVLAAMWLFELNRFDIL